MMRISLSSLPILTFFPLEANPGLPKWCRAEGSHCPPQAYGGSTGPAPVGFWGGGRAGAGSQVLELDRSEVSLLVCVAGEGCQTTLWIGLAQGGEKEAWR